MACSITLSGVALGCADAIGGIKEVFIASYDDVVITAASGVVTAITMQNSAKFKHYQFRKATGSLTSTGNIDDAAGTNFVQSDLVLQFNKYNDTAVRNEIAALSVGNLAVIVHTNNNNYVYLGAENPVTATAVTGQTGTAFADGSFYQITLSDFAQAMPLQVTASLIDATIIDFN